jgi:hypothetical protein
MAQMAMSSGRMNVPQKVSYASLSGYVVGVNHKCRMLAASTDAVIGGGPTDTPRMGHRKHCQSGSIYYEHGKLAEPVINLSLRPRKFCQAIRPLRE